MNTPAILTLTLNPALDLSTETPQISPGHKLRCAEPRLDPGGGGINVSRMVARLGGDTTAFVMLGGATGMQLVARLQKERISTRIIQISGETRQSLSVKDAASGEQFRFMLPGPAPKPSEYDDAIAALAEEAARGDYVVISGSLPTGADPGFAARLAVAMADRDAKLVVDTSGDALSHLIRTPSSLEVLRFDSVEAEEAAGRPLPEKSDTARFAADLIARDVARCVVIGRGPEGNVMVDSDGAWFSTAAKVEVVSTIGAGDSLLAAFVWALSQGHSRAEALRWGSAAASGAVATPGTNLCDLETVERLIEECRAEPITL